VISLEKLKEINKDYRVIISVMHYTLTVEIATLMEKERIPWESILVLENCMHVY
jgi:hypothetical protein